jgi:hypothetical protein
VHVAAPWAFPVNGGVTPVRMPAAAAAAPCLAVHTGVWCDRSGMTPIVGVRCHLPGENYDLCAAEFEKLSTPDRCRFVIVERPGEAPVAYSEAMVNRSKAAPALGAPLYTGDATAATASTAVAIYAHAAHNDSGDSDSDGYVQDQRTATRRHNTRRNVEEADSYYTTRTQSSFLKRQPATPTTARRRADGQLYGSVHAPNAPPRNTPTYRPVVLRPAQPRF